MIIIGYPGIGKSSVAADDERYIDLESSKYRYANGAKHPVAEWEFYYTIDAIKFSEEGFNVFVSTHSEVTKELVLARRAGEFDKLVLVYPRVEKALWIKRLEDRYNNDPSDKNLRALEHARENYDTDIFGLMRLVDKVDVVIPIFDMSYELKSLIESNLGGESD